MLDDKISSDVASIPENLENKDADFGVRVLVAATHEDLHLAEDTIRAENNFSPEEYKRMLWKVDLLLMPLLMITYGLQYSDKQSLSSGVLFGLRADTGLIGNQYANLTSFFYMAYGVSQIPMSWVIQRFPIGKSLSLCVIVWGAMVMCLAVCNNYAQLSVVRVVLGWFEAVITPGFAILTSSWYLRKEQTLRQGLYFAMNTMFGMIFSVGIYFVALRAETHGGMQAWRVINLFLGGTTVGVGILNFIFIGTPQEVWWLSKREKQMAHARIISNATGGAETHPWKWSQVKECFQDPQYYFALLFNVLVTVPNGALTTFGALVYESFGFSALNTILYGLPTNAVGFLFVLGCAIIVRYYPAARFHLAILCQLLAAAVFLYVGLAPPTASTWAKWSAFIFASVYSVTMFMIWPLMTVNIAGRTKKTWYSSTSLITYCVGNIVGSQIFLPSDAPKYLHGLTACAIVMAANVILLVCWKFYYYKVNKNRDATFANSGLSVDEQDYQRKLAGETDMTDLREPKGVAYANE